MRREAQRFPIAANKNFSTKTDRIGRIEDEIETVKARRDSPWRRGSGRNPKSLCGVLGSTADGKGGGKDLGDYVWQHCW